MKQTIFLLLALGLLLCLCACAEKKTEESANAASREEPTEIILTIGPDEDEEDDGIASDGDKTPIGDIQNSIRKTTPTEEKEFEAEPLPTLTWPEISDPEPVEPETEVAES